MGEGGGYCGLWLVRLGVRLVRGQVKEGKEGRDSQW